MHQDNSFFSFLFVGAVNTLSVREERYFKPSPSAFIKVAERGPDAWQIRPGSYFLLPFKEAFGRQIPRDFTIFLTIKPTDESEVRAERIDVPKAWLYFKALKIVHI